MGILGAGLYLLSRLESQSGIGQIVAALIGRRPGRRHVRVSQHQRLMGAAPRHQQGVAAGVMATARNVGNGSGGGLGWGAVDHDCGFTAQIRVRQERCFVPSMADSCGSGCRRLGCISSAIGGFARCGGSGACPTLDSAFPEIMSQEE